MQTKTGTRVKEKAHRLLEKKANYYLQVEKQKGTAPDWIGKEVETINDLLEYAEFLEILCADLEHRHKQCSELYQFEYQSGQNILKTFIELFNLKS